MQRARVPLKAKEIDTLLEQNGIKLVEGEKYNITVDTSCFITVTGNDTEKAKKIQDILNNTDYMGYSLNQLTSMYSDRYKVKEGEEYNRLFFHEMDSESTIRELSNGELSLKDLSVKNGKILGLTPELDALIKEQKQIWMMIRKFFMDKYIQ